jgi:hypothetical protein
MDDSSLKAVDIYARVSEVDRAQKLSGGPVCVSGTA